MADRRDNPLAQWRLNALCPIASANKSEGGRTPKAWFGAPHESLMCFDGLWVPQWTSVRKIKEGLMAADLFGFLTTEPNAVVAHPPESDASHLSDREEIETWLSAPWEEASKLQRPLAYGRIVLLPPVEPMAAVERTALLF